MLENLKKSHLIINIILGLLVLFLLINFSTLGKTSYEFLSLAIIIPTALMILVFGYERKSRRFKYELIFYVFVYCALFLLITYMAGLIIGFNKSVYKLNYTNLTHNIIPYIILIISGEVLRYEITRKGDGSLLSFILCIKKVKQSKMRVADSIIWVIGSFLLILMSIFSNAVAWISAKLGFMAPVNFVFFVVIVFLLVENFLNNIKISMLNEKVKNLNHYIALEEYRKEK